MLERKELSEILYYLLQIFYKFTHCSTGLFYVPNFDICFRTCNSYGSWERRINRLSKYYFFISNRNCKRAISNSYFFYISYQIIRLLKNNKYSSATGFSPILWCMSNLLSFCFFYIVLHLFIYYFPMPNLSWLYKFLLLLSSTVIVMKLM